MNLDDKILGRYLDRSLELLLKLLSFNTCQPQGNENRLIDEIIGWFPQGTRLEKLVHSLERSSLIVWVPGRSHENALAFVGHVDTVPYGARENWTTDPGIPTRSGDRIYGRGASDMKGGVAAMTTAALYLLEQGIVPERDVLFCYTADEESTGLGAKALNLHPAMEQVGEMIVCEPTNGQISLGEKGALWLRIAAHGAQSHGSRPELGINAVEMLCELQRRVREKLDTTSLHPMLGRSTMAVTGLRGGISTNVVPAEAEMELDIRLIPGQENTEVEMMIRHTAEELCEEEQPLEFSIEVLNSRPAVAVEEDAPLVRRMQEAAGSLGQNKPLRATIFYTDASQLIPAHQIPFLILGPGDDALAHQSCEFITISSLREVTELYLTYIRRYMI